MTFDGNAFPDDVIVAGLTTELSAYSTPAPVFVHVIDDERISPPAMVMAQFDPAPALTSSVPENPVQLSPRTIAPRLSEIAVVHVTVPDPADIQRHGNATTLAPW